MTQPTNDQELEGIPVAPTPEIEPAPGSVRPKRPAGRPSMPAFVPAPLPAKDPRLSTTNEDIDRADGEGMAPVLPPRHHVD